MVWYYRIVVSIRTRKGTAKSGEEEEVEGELAWGKKISGNEHRLSETRA